MTPTTPPSAGTGRYQASPRRPHCPPSRSAAAPARASRRASRRGRSTPGLASLQPCGPRRPGLTGPRLWLSGPSGRPLLWLQEQGRGSGRRDWSARDLLASRTASCLQLPPPYPRPRPEEPNLGQARTEVTSRRQPWGRARELHPPVWEGAARARRSPVGRVLWGRWEVSLSWLRDLGTGRGSCKGGGGRSGIGRDRLSAAWGQGVPHLLCRGRQAVWGRPVEQIPAGTFKNTAGGALNQGILGACPSGETLRRAGSSE